MSPHSSSTSSSEPTRASQLRELSRVAVWTLVFLLAIDAGLGVWIGDPPRGPEQARGTLQRYFEYGRSTESKIRDMIGPSDDLTHPLALSGWIEPPVGQPRVAPAGAKALVAVYGMSFSANVALAMHEQIPELAVRNAGGPGATLAHSYAMYQRDRLEHEAHVIVLGVLASSFPSLSTLTHATWNFEAPSPHFYPRYRLEGGALAATPAPIASLAELREALADPARFEALRAALERGDAFYDELVFRESALDRSLIARALRRAWGQRGKRGTIARFHGPNGYTNELGAIDVSHAILREFAASVRGDGRLPVLLLIHDRGYADHLYRAFRPAIEATGVDFVSTHEIAPAANLANFVRDGHFTKENDRAIGRALGQRILDRLDGKRAAPSVP